MPKKPKPGKKVAVSKEDLKKIIEKKKEIDERNKAYEDKKNELKQNKLKKKKAPVNEEIKNEQPQVEVQQEIKKEEPQKKEQEQKNPEVKKEEVKKEAAPQKAPTDLDVIQKTMTDLYPGADMDQLLDYGIIVNSKGEPFVMKGTKDQRYADLVNAMKSPEGVYAQNLIQDEKSQKVSYNLKLNNNEIKRTEVDSLIVDSDIKQEVLENLEIINKELSEYKTKNPNLKALQENCGDLLEDLKGTVKEKDFNRKVKDFARDADHYYMNIAAGKLNKDHSTKLATVSKIRNMRDAVEKKMRPSDNQIDATKALQDRIAAKYIKAYCTIMKDEPLTEQNAKAKDVAKEIEENPARYQAYMNQIKNDPAFQYLYGGDSPESLRRIRDAATGKAASVFKAVQKEIADPTPERERHEAFMKQKEQGKNRDTSFVRFSDDELSVVSQEVNKMNSVLAGMKGTRGYKDPAFKQLRHDVLVAQIRLARGNKYTNVRAMMAKIGESADKVSMRLANTTGVSSKMMRVMATAERGRAISDKVCSGKNITPISDLDAMKRTLAGRLAGVMAGNMTTSPDRRIQEQGHLMQINPDKFDKAASEIANSQAFQELYYDEKSIKAALSELGTHTIFDEYDKLMVKNNEIYRTKIKPKTKEVEKEQEKKGPTEEKGSKEKKKEESQPTL